MFVLLGMRILLMLTFTVSYVSCPEVDELIKHQVQISASLLQTAPNISLRLNSIAHSSQQ
jgi:hypothetical protein